LRPKVESLADEPLELDDEGLMRGGTGVSFGVEEDDEEG